MELAARKGMVYPGTDPGRTRLGRRGEECQPRVRTRTRAVRGGGVSGRERWRDWIPRPQGRPLRQVTRFPQRPGLWDLAASPEVVPHWAAILRGNLRYSLERAAADGKESTPAAQRRVEAILMGLFDDLERGVATATLRTIHEVTLVREAVLRAHALHDPYRAIKAREAERLLPQAAERLARAWVWGGQAADSEPLAELLAGLLAGNLFDLGSALTQEAFRSGCMDHESAAERYRRDARRFLAQLEPSALARLCAQPRALEQPPEGRVLLFADNAGADYLLGLLPAALFWARRWEVVVVLNALPVASDIAFAESGPLFEALARTPGSPLPQAIDAGRLRCVPSGTGSPGIDLRYVGAALDRAAEGCAWLLLDGQGRGIETNWPTRFRCPALRCAVVKDRLVAHAIGAAAPEPVLRWDEAWPGWDAEAHAGKGEA
ncbi:MAG: DUF89 family protein [Candidatus Eisenbacteria bacterium]|nr:DUF89 family protein [Candidatus Eisenbacteria bacterium]